MKPPNRSRNTKVGQNYLTNQPRDNSLNINLQVPMAQFQTQSNSQVQSYRKITKGSKSPPAGKKLSTARSFSKKIV